MLDDNLDIRAEFSWFGPKRMFITLCVCVCVYMSLRTQHYTYLYIYLLFACQMEFCHEMTHSYCRSNRPHYIYHLVRGYFFFVRKTKNFSIFYFHFSNQILRFHSIITKYIWNKRCLQQSTEWNKMWPNKRMGKSERTEKK